MVGGGGVFLFLLCCKKPALGLCVILVLYCIVSTVGARVSFLFVNFVIDVVAKLMIFPQQDLAKFGYRLDMKVKKKRL